MQAGLKQLIEHVGSLHERGTKGGNSRTVWTFFNRIHPSESLSELAFVSAGGKNSWKIPLKLVKQRICHSTCLHTPTITLQKNICKFKDL